MQLNVLRILMLAVFLGGVTQNALGQVVINEYMVSNLCSPNNPNVIQDNFGDCNDWVELYNPTGADFDLEGYFFTDNADNLTKYEFPAGAVIPANGYLRLWLSGRPNVPFDINNIHIDFMIGQMDPNEIIALVEPDGTTIADIDEVENPSQLGHTRGRFPDGADDWVIFTAPTMGASNNGNTPYTDYAPVPQFSVPAGYQGAGNINVEISLSDPNPDFTIRYTLDGSFPTPASPLYTGPININNTTVLTAAAFSADADYLRSFYQYSTYFFGADEHALPVVSIHGDQVQQLLEGNQALEPLTAMEIFDVSGQRISKNFGDTNEHGNDSNAYGQRGFDWIDRDKMGYSDATHLELFSESDRDAFKRLIFKAGANDNYPFSGGAHVRDAYLHDLSMVGDLELDERTTEFCIVYVNGNYWGVYDYREKADDWRYTEYYYDQGEFDIDYIKTWGGTWEEYGSIADWDALENFIMTNDMTDQTNYEYVKTELEVMSLIDYFAINTWAVCSDWLNWNTAWWKGNNEFGDAQKWRYVLWDMDASFGHYINYTGIPNTNPDADPCFGEQLNDPGGQGHTSIVSALLNNEEFFNTWINRYAELRNTTFSCEFAVAHLDGMIGEIEPEMQRQINRWGGTYAGWEAAVDELRNFILARCEDNMIEGMEDCYDLESIEVTIMIEGEGEVQLNGITITPDMQPWTGVYYAGIPLDFEAIEYADGTFQFWESLSGDIGIGDETQFEIEVTPDGDITIVAHFVPLVKHQIAFDVEPAGAGSIEINGDLISNFLYTDSLTAGPEHNLIAVPEPGWGFTHWESTTHPVSAFNPDELTDEVGYTLEQPDTVIAHFEILPLDLTILVDQPGMGTVALNGTELPNYPHTESILPGSDVELEATPEDGYEFIGWIFQNHTVSNLEDLLVNFEITQQDTVTAVFELITDFNVVIMSDPDGFGNLTLDGEDIGSYWEGILSILEDYSLTANGAGPFYEFVGWQSTSGAIFDPNTDFQNITLNITGADTIIAMFVELPNFPITVRVEPANAGRVMLDWSVLPELPWTGNVLGMDHTDFKALPNNEWQFSHWTTQVHDIEPNEKLEEVWMDIYTTDEIVAHFVPREFHFYMPNSFSPNGDGINDIFRPVGNEWVPEEFLMQIFNRNGEIVFETDDPNTGWNGSEAGKTHYVETEVYVYRVEVRNAITQESETFSGHVTVLR